MALSRAIGDFDFKKNYNMPAEQQIITSDPDIEIHELSDEDEFFVIACDGKISCDMRRKDKLTLYPRRYLGLLE